MFKDFQSFLRYVNYINNLQLIKIQFSQTPYLLIITKSIHKYLYHKQYFFCW